MFSLAPESPSMSLAMDKILAKVSIYTTTPWTSSTSLASIDLINNGMSFDTIETTRCSILETGFEDEAEDEWEDDVNEETVDETDEQESRMLLSTVDCTLPP
jgi:hypothetical protein